MSGRLERRGGVVVEISGEIETVKAGHPRCRYCGSRLRPVYETETGERLFEGRISESRPAGAGWRRDDWRSEDELEREFGIDAVKAREASATGVPIWVRERNPIRRRTWLGRFSGIDGEFCNNSCAIGFARMMARTKRGWASPRYFEGREDELRRSSELEEKIG